MAITLQQFIDKWKSSQLKERSAAQEHFIDLCRLLGVETPAEADPKGTWYTFEAGAAKLGGGDGWADVWMKGHFAWEYKGKHKDLTAAYAQLLLYKDDLANPPILVVCDMERFEIHTNFTGTVKRVYAFTLDGLKENLHVLRAIFQEPGKLKPTETPEAVTEAVSLKLGPLAKKISDRGHDPHKVAHFIMQLMFCMFAEDIRLLPDYPMKVLLGNTKGNPKLCAKYMRDLFSAMRTGGDFNMRMIRHFNGGLFNSDEVIELEKDEIAILHDAAGLDWSGVEPAIFGTLFERGLDPDQRQQLGAHYTHPDDIMAILNPVIFDPLRKEWDEVRAATDKLVQRAEKAESKKNRMLGRQRKLTKDEREAASNIDAFLLRLKTIKVLDPACGSGNFLYLALRGLKDLEGEVINYARKCKLGSTLPFVGPAQFFGIELNPYAQELAQVVIWIGHLQWMHLNAYTIADTPILKKLDNIRRGDALLQQQDGMVFSPAWPEVDYIVGNPPFLGGKYLRRILSDAYVNLLHKVYKNRVSRGSDLVVYFFERAREQIERGKAKRAGLVATQGIRNGVNRDVIKKIKQSGDLFMAWPSRPWVLAGANVRVAMLGFDDGSQKQRFFNGELTERINPDLTIGPDCTKARPLKENIGIQYMGDTSGGKFGLTGQQAAEMLKLKNPHGKPNSDVVRPWANGMEVSRRPLGLYIVDFGTDMEEDEAALYEAPYEHIKGTVMQAHADSRTTRTNWWLHERPRPKMRKALKGLKQFFVTLTLAKHRVFVRVDGNVLPDHQLIVIAREDWFTFGILQSRIHEVWSLRTGSEQEDRPRYTPTTTLLTFPFPDNVTRKVREDVEAAAKSLEEMRSNALKNDPKLTLTTLYNKRPGWLDLKHKALDRAVRAAYKWSDNISDEQMLDKLLAMNLARPAATKADIKAAADDDEDEEEEASA